MDYGKEFYITAEDVRISLGLPCGTRRVDKIVPFENRMIAAEWRKHLGKEDDHANIRAHHIVSSIEKSTNNHYFIRDFIILVFTCLFETPQSGVASQNLIMKLSDMRRIAEYDLCDFVLRCLDEATVRWQANRTSSFTGPIILLVVSM